MKLRTLGKHVNMLTYFNISRTSLLISQEFHGRSEEKHVMALPRLSGHARLGL